jgi:hypothetical protein
MKQLPIVWKRLVVDGHTCERCGATSGQLQRAIEKLEAALRPLGIQPVFETQAIDERTFKAQPSESNRIWIAGRPMEEWLGAEVGMSRCCSVCGESDCRTLKFAGQTFETVPAELLIKAGLIAASGLLADGGESCCATDCADQTSRCG